MYLTLRNISTCIMLLTTIICFAGPVQALEIEWGAPSFGNAETGVPVIAPDVEAPAAASDPDSSGLEKGFRGVSWGLTKEQMEDDLKMEFVQCVELPGARLSCAVQGANKSIRDIPLKLLRYKFIGEVFYGISLKYDAKYEKDMYAIYKEFLGPPTDYRETFPVWHGDTYKAWATNTHFSFASKKVLKKNKHKGGTF